METLLERSLGSHAQSRRSEFSRAEHEVGHPPKIRFTWITINVYYYMNNKLYNDNLRKESIRSFDYFGGEYRAHSPGFVAMFFPHRS